MEGQEEVAEKDYGEFCGIEALWNVHQPQEISLYYVLMFSSTEKALPLWCAITTRRHCCYLPPGTCQGSHSTSTCMWLTPSQHQRSAHRHITLCGCLVQKGFQVGSYHSQSKRIYLDLVTVREQILYQVQVKQKVTQFIINEWQELLMIQTGMPTRLKNPMNMKWQMNKLLLQKT
jgi:hypothetical protein